MLVIPAIDVLDGRVVRLREGDFAHVTVFGGHPVPVALQFRAEGAAPVHVVDLGAARSGRTDESLWRSLGAEGVAFQAAGGLRTVEVAVRACDLGASRIVAGTAAVWDPAVLEEMVSALGPERVVAAVDVRDGRARGAAWTDDGMPVGEVVTAAGVAGVGRLMVTAVARDGMLSGPDLSLLEWVIEAAGRPVIASGGVGSLDDLRRVAALGAEAVVVGRALYEGRFTLGEAVEAAR